MILDATTVVAIEALSRAEARRILHAHGIFPPCDALSTEILRGMVHNAIADGTIPLDERQGEE